MGRRIIKTNEPAMPTIKSINHYGVVETTTSDAGMPILLQIAKDFACAHITGSVYSGFSYDAETIASLSLKDAETLIKTYNERL